jgi:hypothetical protein
METDNAMDARLAARLKRLDAVPDAAPSFGYDEMLARREHQQTRARRRSHAARATASVLVVALVGASLWRLDQGVAPVDESAVAVTAESPPQPRIVRADSYLAVAALEDHIASVDDALSVARAYSPSGAEVARLERTRAELLDSYSRVRYAEMVSATF